MTTVGRSNLNTAWFWWTSLTPFHFYLHVEHKSWKIGNTEYLWHKYSQKDSWQILNSSLRESNHLAKRKHDFETCEVGYQHKYDSCVLNSNTKQKEKDTLGSVPHNVLLTNPICYTIEQKSAHFQDGTSRSPPWYMCSCCGGVWVVP